jgi:hypothetical protein
VAALVAGCLLAINPCRRVVYGQRMPAARRFNGRMIRRSRACRQATHSTEAAFRQEIAVSLQHCQVEERLTLGQASRLARFRSGRCRIFVTSSQGMRSPSSTI